MVAMKRCWLVFVVTMVMVSTSVLSDDPQPQDEWGPDEYPNPLRAEDRERCGVSTDKVSYICDPNHLIPLNEVSQVNTLIEQIMNQTRCPCSNNICESRGPPGYRIEVALMNRIKVNENDPQPDDPLQAALQKTEKFARDTLRRWNNRRCDEDVIVVYSLEDNVLYTFVGQEASKKLDRYAVADIQMTLRGYFTPSGNRFEGLRHLLSSYKAVFLGTYKGMEYKYQAPRHEPVVGGGASPVTTIAIVTTVTTLLVSLFCSGPLF